MESRHGSAAREAIKTAAIHEIRTAGEEEAPRGAVAKAALVLESFPPARATVGVTELSRRSGLAKSTTHRVLQTLEELGLVERMNSGYRLGSRLRQLADAFEGRSPSELRDCVLPYMLNLYEDTHLAIHLGVWSGSCVRIIENLHGGAGTRVPPAVGSRVPAHCTALGKVLLAYADSYARTRLLRGHLPAFTSQTIVCAVRLEHELNSIRQGGLAYSRGEFLPGITHVAAPVWREGKVGAAISVSGRADHFDVDAVAGHLRSIAYAASSTPCPGNLPRSVATGGKPGAAQHRP